MAMVADHRRVPASIPGPWIGPFALSANPFAHGWAVGSSLLAAVPDPLSGGVASLGFLALLVLVLGAVVLFVWVAGRVLAVLLLIVGVLLLLDWLFG